MNYLANYLERLTNILKNRTNLSTLNLDFPLTAATASFFVSNIHIDHNLSQLEMQMNRITEHIYRKLTKCKMRNGNEQYNANPTADS